MTNLVISKTTTNEIYDKDAVIIPSFSKLGHDGDIGSGKSRTLEQGFEYDSTWLVDYSIQFQGCHGIVQYGKYGDGQQQQQQQQQQQRGDDEGESALFMQNLVKFRLCPVDSCNKDCKGLYLVDLNVFVESYVQWKQETSEKACENIREVCVCDDDDAIDDEECENNCYLDAGLDYCIENDENGDYGDNEEFEIQRFLGCQELDDYNYEEDDDVKYYVGPRCSNRGNAIYLDVFEDSGCIQPAPSGTYEQYNYYGYSLPYSKSSLVEKDCVPCKQSNDDDDKNRNDGEIELIEFCEETYEIASKCERGLDIEYPQNNDCNFIKSEILTHDSHYKHPKTAIIFCWILLCTTLALGHKVMTLQNEMERSNVKLTEHEGGMIA